MKIWWLNRRRQGLAKRVQNPALSQFLSKPLPRSRTGIRECEFVCLDLETTGLDASHCDLLSAGWVLIRNGRVDISSCESYLVRPSGEVGASATIHGLTDTEVGRGEDRQAIFDRILAALAGRILVVHHAGLDKAVLDRLCVERSGSTLPVPVIDTLAIELRRQRRQHHVSAEGGLRLAELRTHYGLPHYQAHDCLVDAIATAELFLAMIARHDGKTATSLSHWLN